VTHLQIFVQFAAADKVSINTERCTVPRRQMTLYAGTTYLPVCHTGVLYRNGTDHHQAINTSW